MGWETWPKPAQLLFCAPWEQIWFLQNGSQQPESTPQPQMCSVWVTRCFLKSRNFTKKIQFPTFSFKKKKIMMMILLILATFPNGRGQQTIPRSDLSSVFINKVLFEHSFAHSLMYSLWLLLLYCGRAEKLQQRLYGCKAENIYSLTLCRKGLLTPARWQ